MGTGIELSNAPVWSGALTGQEVFPMGHRVIECRPFVHECKCV